MDGELRQRAARRLGFVPAPGLRREFERPFVGEVGLDEGDPAQFAGIDRIADLADARQQPGAVTDRHRDAVEFFERLDLETVFQRRGDRLFCVNVLFGLGDFAGDRQMLLVRNGEDDARDFWIGEHGLQIGNGGDAHLLGKGRARCLGAAKARDNLQFVGLFAGAGQDLGPAAEADNAEFDGICAHGRSFH